MEPYKLTITGIRHSNQHTNKFDDRLLVEYLSPGIGRITEDFQITTDPGTKSLKYPVNPKGTAILVPGTYDSYAIDLHNGKYEALCQRRGPVKVYRDSNRDTEYNYTNTDEGYFGINIHKAGEKSTIVDGWSAGCQVFANEDDFNWFMSLCRIHRHLYGNKFTYTLINESDIS